MEIPRKAHRRRAVSGVVGALILFGMLFTVGFGFFTFQLTNDSRFATSFYSASGLLSNRISEGLTVTTLLYNNHIGVYFNNTGGVPVNVISLFVMDKFGTVLKCIGVGVPSLCVVGSPFPVYVNVGSGSAIIDTGYAPSTGATYAVRVVSQRGSMFTGTYPPSTVSLAAQALSSGAIGDLYLQFHSFTWYTISTCNGNQYCIQNPKPGFAIPLSALSNPMAFSIQVTNLNSQQLSITLDQYTFLTEFVACGPNCDNSVTPTYTWYLVANNSNVLTPVNTIVLFYNKPVTIVFASQSPGTLNPYPACTSQCPTKAFAAFGFIISHGCLGISQSKCGTSTDNYGQVAPYVSSLYY